MATKPSKKTTTSPAPRSTAAKSAPKAAAKASEKKSTPRATKSKSGSFSPSYEDVARKAYLLWIDKGQPQGCDFEIWIEAEQQLSSAA